MSSVSACACGQYNGCALEGIGPGRVCGACGARADVFGFLVRARATDCVWRKGWGRGRDASSGTAGEGKGAGAIRAALWAREERMHDGSVGVGE